RAGVRLAGSQAHIRTHRAGVGETGRVFDGKEEALGRQRAHSGDLGEKGTLRIVLLSRLLDQFVQGLDLLGELLDGGKDRGKSRPQSLGDVTLDLRGEDVGPATREATPERL